MNTYELKLDLSKGPLHRLGSASDYGGVTLRQGDKRGCTIVAELYDHGEAYAEAGLSAYFVMELPDGEHYYRAPAAYAAGKVTVVVDEEYAAAVPGCTDNAYFELLQGSNVIASTESFRVRVLPDARGDKEPGEVYNNEIDAALVAVRAATTDAQQATEGANQAKGRVDAAVAGAAAATNGANAAADDARAAAEEARGAISPDLTLYLAYDTVGSTDYITLVDASE